MNGAKKWHSPDGPAFNVGEIWEGVGGHKVQVYGRERKGEGKWDVDIFYIPYGPKPVETGYVKNAWSFQVRYQHIADKEI